MSRPTFRRTIRLETLESRELLTAGGPSAEAQYMLVELNLARTNPSAAAQQFTNNLDANTVATLQYYNVDLNAVRTAIASEPVRPPLAWNDSLASAATAQSQYQSDTQTQTHYGPNNSTPGERIDAAGYKNRVSNGENAYAYSESVTEAMQAFLIDWGNAGLGHRNNIYQPGATDSQIYREVGIGIVKTNNPNFGPEVITQDFAASANALPELVGVAYNDPTHAGQYTMGSGVGNVEIDATNLSSGKTTSTMTWDAGGGYQISLAPGNYSVTAKVGDKVVKTQNVSIGNTNVEVDYNLSQPWQTPVAPPTPTPVVTPTPVAKPTPVFTPTPTPVVAPAPVAKFTPVIVATPTPVVTPTPAPVVATPKGVAISTPAVSAAPVLTPTPVAQAPQTISVASVTAADTTSSSTDTTPAAVTTTPTVSSWFSSWSSWTARKSNVN